MLGTTKLFSIEKDCANQPHGKHTNSLQQNMSSQPVSNMLVNKASIPSQMQSNTFLNHSISMNHAELVTQQKNAAFQIELQMQKNHAYQRLRQRYEDYKVKMSTIISQLGSQIGSQIEKSSVSYWCPKMECYVYIGQILPDESNEESKAAAINQASGDKNLQQQQEMGAQPLDQGGQKVEGEGEEEKQVRSALAAEECVSDLLDFQLIQVNEPDAAVLASLREGTHEIKLKFRPKAKAQNTDSLIQGRTQTGQPLGSRREKERIIGEVVIKVSEWRRMYI